MPFSVSFCKGRITALCSIDETTTWSPLLRIPFITVLSAEVQLSVKMIFSSFGKPKKSAAVFLVLKISSEALMARS